MILIFAPEIECDPSLAVALERAGMAFRFVETEEHLLDHLDGPDGEAIEVCLYDLGLRPDAAVEQLRALTQTRPGLRIIACSALASISTAVASMKAGAVDFLPAPVSPAKLIAAMATMAEAQPPPAAKPKEASRRKPGARSFDTLIAESHTVRSVIREARRGANSLIPMLLNGESGVGKEVFARAIHAESARADGPFVAVNCGAIPESLVESILFGHEKGAFTGAFERRTGKFVEAHGGVLFLDEIGELPLDGQVKLLRAIQEGEVDPVGGGRPIKTDIRVISATNRDLVGEVEAGRFREDLFYRISVFPITIPPLRRRIEDIVPLAHLFARMWGEVEGRPFDGFTPEAEAALRDMRWTGNVRQLENAVHRAVVLSDKAMIDADMFKQSGLVPAHAVGGDAGASLSPFFGADGHVRALSDIEEDAMAAALDRYDQSMSEAARRLGVGRSTLYRRMRGEEAA